MTIDGELVVTTEDHPFWSVTDQMWEDADDLAVGEFVQTAAGVVVPVTSTVDLDTSRVLPAYNLTVADIHTYFVIVGKAPVLVHNCGDAESLAGSLDEDTFFHYTDDDGMRGIMGEDGAARIGQTRLVRSTLRRKCMAPVRRRRAYLLEIRPIGGAAAISLHSKCRRERGWSLDHSPMK